MTKNFIEKESDQAFGLIVGALGYHVVIRCEKYSMRCSVMLHAASRSLRKGIPVCNRGETRRPVRIGLIVTIAACAWLFGRVSVAANHHAVTANQDFSNPTLQLHAPASSGWYGISQTPSQIAFGKEGVNGGETFVAAVFLFRIPTFPDKESFTEYVREGVIKDSPTDRFDTVEQSVQYSSERNYGCVRYHGISIDKKARTSAFFRKSLRIEDIALYCQHPYKPGLGFSVSYSHRGGSPDYTIDEEAEAFIDSVQATSPSKTP